MSKSTRMTPEQLKLMGLEEYEPGKYRPITNPATFTRGIFKRHEDGKIKFVPDEKGPWEIADGLNEEPLRFSGVDPASDEQSHFAVVNHHPDGTKEIIHKDKLLMPELIDEMVRVSGHYNAGASHELIKLIVLGEPKAQKRHRHFKGKNMSFTTTYDPSKADKKDFLSIVQANAPEKPLDQPLHLEIGFYFGRPKSHFKTGKNAGIVKDSAPEWHTGRPDVDNLFKFCTDALTKVYWRDDSLVCSTTIIKKYSDNPRTEIIIKKL